MATDRTEERVHEILIIEENLPEARLMQEAWSICDTIKVHTSTLTNSADAIVYLRGFPPYGRAPRPDLVILDYKMPVNGGLALTEIKGDPDFIDLPVLVVTGSIDPKDHLEAYRRHANVVYAKPQDFDGYCALVHGLAECWLKQALPPRG